MPILKARISVPAVVLGLVLAAAAPASATTFCVPSFHAACPSGGGNVAQTSLETAMQANGNDGIDDRIVIAAGTFTDPDTFENGGSDDLEITGAGPAATVITSSDNGNQFVVNLAAAGGRDVTMRDLTIVVPASFPDGLGGAMQAQQDTFENVDIESRNPGGDGVSMVGGGIYRDGRLYGAMGGSIDLGIRTNGAVSGELVIERNSIESPSWGVLVDDIDVVTRVRRTQIIDPVAYGVRVTTGAFAVVENSVIVIDDGFAFSIVTGTPETVIFNARHNTIVDTGGDNDPAIFVGDNLTPSNGTINAVINDTIIAGNQDPLGCDSPMSNTTLTMRYSYFFHSATVNGNCTIPTINTIDAFGPAGSPQFVGPADYHLPAGSPAIDTGDPLTVSLPTVDYDGAPRPVDGNGDGNVRRDMGAFEYQPPLPVPPPATNTPTATPAPATKACKKKKKRKKKTVISAKKRKKRKCSR